MASFVSVYARALADVVMERKLDAGRVASDLDAVSALLKESTDLRTVFDNPSVPHEQKLKVLDALAERMSLLKEIRNFTAVLISNRRIHAFGEIAAEAMVQINSRLGIAEAEIISARELTSEEKHKIEAQVAKATGKSLRVRYSLENGLIGGVLVKVGSTIYDGSVHGQLQRMKEQLTAIS
jgi:F-type H+-transporting ATPase subunit delta